MDNSMMAERQPDATQSILQNNGQSAQQGKEDDDEWEYDTDNTKYVILDLSTAQIAPQNITQYAIIGLEQRTPVLQLTTRNQQRMTFMGSLDETIGEDILFTSQGTSNEVSHDQGGMKFLATTTKKVQMKRVYLKPKSNNTNNTNNINMGTSTSL